MPIIEDGDRTGMRSPYKDYSGIKSCTRASKAKERSNLSSQGEQPAMLKASEVIKLDGVQAFSCGRYTAEKTSKIKTSDRYPGWVMEVEKARYFDYKFDLENGIDEATAKTKEEWFCTKKSVGYAVQIYKVKGEYLAELFTRQRFNGTVTWEAIPDCRKPFYGTPAECFAEAERRAAYWDLKGSSDVYGERLKLSA